MIEETLLLLLGRQWLIPFVLLRSEIGCSHFVASVHVGVTTEDQSKLL